MDLYKKPKSIKKFRPEGDPDANKRRTYWAMHRLYRNGASITIHVPTSDLGREDDIHVQSYVVYSTASSPKVMVLCETETVENAELIAKLANRDEKDRSHYKVRNEKLKAYRQGPRA